MIGIKEDDGYAREIIGIPDAGLDDYKRHLEQVILSGLEPRLPRVDMHVVGCGDARVVIIIRVARSWIAPHRIIRNSRFYGRHSALAQELDVSELRTVFALSSSTIERIREFRDERVNVIGTNLTPASLERGAVMIVHAVPFSSFASNETRDIVSELHNKAHLLPGPPARGTSSFNYRPNLDGLAVITRNWNEPVGGYTQVFRSGAVEGTLVLVAGDGKGESILHGGNFEEHVIDAARRYVRFMEQLELGFPIFVLLSFIGMQSCSMRVPMGIGYDTRPPLQQNIIRLPEAVIEGQNTSIPDALRLTLNTVWNAYGLRDRSQVLG